MRLINADAEIKNRNEEIKLYQDKIKKYEDLNEFGNIRVTKRIQECYANIREIQKEIRAIETVKLEKRKKRRAMARNMILFVINAGITIFSIWLLAGFLYIIWR